MNSYKFINNRRCKYFPCHEGIAKKDFNCLFCYCPLYALKDKCGGNFRYYKGIKDCSLCKVPHLKKNYDYMNERFKEIIDMVRVPYDETENEQEARELEEERKEQKSE